MQYPIVGLQSAVAGINAHLNQIIEIQERTMARAMLYVKREVLPITPASAHGSNLRDSCYTNTYKTPFGPVGEIGFTAEYAIFVHEMGVDPPKPINWTTPGTGNKFLERVLKEHMNEIVEIVAGTR